MAEPVVGLAEIIEDQLRTVGLAGSQNDGRRAVGLRGDPSAVIGIEDGQRGEAKNHDGSDLLLDDRRLLGNGLGSLLLALGRSGSRVLGLLELLLSIVGLNKLAHIGGHSVRKADGSHDAGDRGQHEDETDHNSRKVHRSDSIEDEEDVSVRQVLEAVVQACREEEHQRVEVEKERRPGGRLVLRHRSNDGNMLLGIRGVQQRIEAASEVAEVASGGANDCHERGSSEGGDNRHLEDGVEVLGGKKGAEPVDATVQLQQAESSKGSHVLGRLNGLEANEVDLHRHQRSHHVKRAVRDVDPVGVTSADDEGQHVKRDEVDDEHISSPGGNHIEVGERAER
mmetsp:Transcript_1944/g.6985  ORF Transcript_1944/g.6985 Transcript_1944/m.6985 type:complete len:339 (-) Transcript_1944:665-1681(-)